MLRLIVWMYFVSVTAATKSHEGMDTLKSFFFNHAFPSVEKAVTAYQSLLPVTATVVNDMVRLLTNPGNDRALLESMQKELKKVEGQIDYLNSQFRNVTDIVEWSKDIENEVRSYESQISTLNKALIYYLTGPPEAEVVLKTIFIGVLRKMPRSSLNQLYQGLRDRKYLQRVKKMLSAENRKALGLLALRLIFRGIMVDMTEKSIAGNVDTFTKTWVGKIAGLKSWAQSLDKPH